MNATLSGTLFDGEKLAGHALVLAIGGGRMQSQTEGTVLDVAVTDVRASDRLASLPRYLYLPDNRTIETPDNDAVDALLAWQSRGRLVAAIHWLEERARAAAAATVLLVVLVSAAVWWGLPVLARRAAMAVPPAIETRVGQTALVTVKQILGPSQLNAADRARVEAQVTRLVKARGLAERPQLVFRSMGGKFPNAFALPGGWIVVSDELVALAIDDDELAAVLAHEFGHWQNRHGLQSLLRNSSALLVVSSVTGDLSTLTTFAGSIPFLMLQRGYSREFEAEADAYAVDLLRQARINVRSFVSILDKLEKSRPASGQDFSYLSTHPATADRIKAIDPTAVYPARADNASVATLAKTSPAQVQAAARPELDLAVNFPVSGQSPPVVLYRTSPIYPVEMAAHGVEGEVTIEFVVDENGKVRTPHVVHSTRKDFEGAALEAVCQWKFSPGQLRGRNVATRISQSVEFTLDQSGKTLMPAVIPATPDLTPKP